MKKLYLICTIALLTNWLLSSQVAKQNGLVRSLNFTDTIFKKAPASLFYGYEVTRWQALIKDYPFDAPGMPDLAWKVGSTFEALYSLYEMTADENVAALYLSLSDDLINTRDDKKQIFAWDGKSHKFWSSGNRYNYAYMNIYDQNNTLKGVLEFKDAKLDQCFVTLTKAALNEFTIVIENERNGEIYRIENTTFSRLENDVKNLDWASYVSDNSQNKVLNYISKDNKNLPVKPLQKQRLASYYVPSIDVNAIHLTSLINAYQILVKKKKKKKAKRYFKFIAETIAVNTNLYLNENEESCYFQYPKNSKTFMGGSVVYPYNKQFAYVAMLSKWNKIAKDKRITELIEKWATYFKSKLEPHDLGLTWRYWDDPTGTIKRFETVNYGGHDIKYLMTIAENSKAFSDKELWEITKAIRANLLLCEDDEVQHKTAFDFKSRAKGLVPVNYLALGNFWPDIFECYEKHVKEDDLNWIDRTQMIYYFNKK